MGDPDKPASASRGEGEKKEDQPVAATPAAQDRAALVAKALETLAKAKETLAKVESRAGEASADGAANADAAKAKLDAEAKARAEAEAKAKAEVERARAEAARKRAEAEKNKAAKSTTMVSAEAPDAPASQAPAADEIKAEPAKVTGAEVIAALGVDPETLAGSPKSTLVSGAPAKFGKDEPATKPVIDAAALGQGDRLTPIAPEPSPLVDQTAAGPNASSLEVQIPPPAVEVSKRRISEVPTPAMEFEPIGLELLKEVAAADDARAAEVARSEKLANAVEVARRAEQQRSLAAQQARAQTKALQSQPSIEIQQTAQMPRFPPPPAPPPPAYEPAEADLPIERADAAPKKAASQPRQGAAPEALALKTRLAQKFTTLADEVNASFADFHVGAGNWGLELTAPEGMSTAGGKQATQSLKMRPKRQGYAPLVAGFVDPVNHSAELRDYPHICLVHELRWQKPLEITEGEWEQLLRKTEMVLKTANIRAVRTPPDQELLAAKKATPTGIMKYGYAPFVLAAAVVGAAIVLWRVIVGLSGPG